MEKKLLKETDDFFKKFKVNVVKDDKLSKVHEEILKKMSEEEYPFPVGHKSNLERAKTYSGLVNQVVGAEWDRNY